MDELRRRRVATRFARETSPSPLRCGPCGIDLDADTERCPRCLRKSTLLGGERLPRGPSYYGLRDGSDVAPVPSHVGVRFAVLVVAYAAFAPLIGAVFAENAWLEAEGLWLSAMFAAMALGMLPLRMAFAPPEGSMASAEAARHYAFRMVAVLGMAAGLFVAQGLASRIVASTVASIFLGLFFFLVPLLAVPAIVAAIRGERSIRAALTGVAKGIGIAVAVVALSATIVVLRASRKSAAPPSFVIPGDPKALLDPLDLEGVRVDASWRPDANGSFTLHLRADGGDFDRTVQKLVVEAIVRVDSLRSMEKANGAITLWLPTRFDGPAHRKKASDEETLVNGALDSKDRTSSGQPIRVAFAFGEPPPH